MTRDTPSATNPIGATETSFRIIERLQDTESSGVSELANALDVSKSTVHNHLQTLVSLGYLVRVDDEYSLGLQFLNLGHHARKRHALYQAAKGEMDDLVEAIGERAQLMVEENGHGVYIYQVKTDQAIQTDSHIGSIVDLHATAVGKSYLAFCAEEKRQQILTRELSGLTSETITSRKGLEAELNSIYDQGHAFNDEEKMTGMRAVGSPIISDRGDLLGSLSVSGPTTRLKGEWYRQRIPEMVKQAARIIGIQATYS